MNANATETTNTTRSQAVAIDVVHAIGAPITEARLATGWPGAAERRLPQWRQVVFFVVTDVRQRLAILFHVQFLPANW